MRQNLGIAACLRTARVHMEVGLGLGHDQAHADVEGFAQAAMDTQLLTLTNAFVCQVIAQAAPGSPRSPTVYSPSSPQMKQRTL